MDRFYRDRSNGTRGLYDEMLSAGSRAHINAPDKCRTSGAHPYFPCAHFTTNELLNSNLNATCDLLNALGCERRACHCARLDCVHAIPATRTLC